LESIPETKKGRTRLEFTPLSMYLRDCRAVTVNRSRSCPIGGRLATSGAALQSSLHERSILPERFRVDCAFGGGVAALSHSRRNYSAPVAQPRFSGVGIPAASILPGLWLRLAWGEPRACRRSSVARRCQVSTIFTLGLSESDEIFLSIWFHGRLNFRHGICSFNPESGFVEGIDFCLWVSLRYCPKTKTCEAYLNPHQPVCETGRWPK
jgi:hypothetical protein